MTFSVPSPSRRPLLTFTDLVSPWPDRQQNLRCSAAFPNNEFQCPKHHRLKPDMKTPQICSSPNMKPQTHRETTALLFFIGTTRNAPDMKQHDLWGELQMRQLSTWRATDVAAGCNSKVVSCRVWSHGGLVVLRLVVGQRQGENGPVQEDP